VNNDRLPSYATQVLGLPNMTHAKASLARALISGVSEMTSVAYEFGGTDLGFARPFDFKTNGSPTTTARRDHRLSRAREEGRGHPAEPPRTRVPKRGSFQISLIRSRNPPLVMM
jgi:hypothetical protein